MDKERNLGIRTATDSKESLRLNTVMASYCRSSSAVNNITFSGQESLRIPHSRSDLYRPQLMITKHRILGLFCNIVLQYYYSLFCSHSIIHASTGRCMKTSTSALEISQNSVRNCIKDYLDNLQYMQVLS